MTQDEDCPWCKHPKRLHTNYYGEGWCTADVMVKSPGIVAPYNIACWCGGTRETRGPRELVGGVAVLKVPYDPAS